MLSIEPPVAKEAADVGAALSTSALPPRGADRAPAKVRSSSRKAPPAPSAPFSEKELRIFLDRVRTAGSPEAIFGELKGEHEEKLAALNLGYLKLLGRCHVKHFAADPKLVDVAEAAFQGLSDIYRAAQERIRSDTYGNSSFAAKSAADTTVIAIVEGKQHTYALRELLCEGDVAMVYRADYKDEKGQIQQACVKIAKTAQDNELLINERSILSELDHVSLPKIVEGFDLPDGRIATAMNFVGGKTFHQLKALPMYKDGIKDEAEYHIGWILERQLALLGYLHKKGVVHGSVEPSHLIVQGDRHNVVLVDFCWAVKNPKDNDHIKIGQEFYSPPEIFDKKTPHPSMDIYGLGKSAVYLLGGDPTDGSVPPSINEMVANFLDRMTIDDPTDRASDAHQLAYHLVVIREELSGKKRPFMPLSMVEKSPPAPKKSAKGGAAK